MIIDLLRDISKWITDIKWLISLRVYTVSLCVGFVLPFEVFSTLKVLLSLQSCLLLPFNQWVFLIMKAFNTFMKLVHLVACNCVSPCTQLPSVFCVAFQRVFDHGGFSSPVKSIRLQACCWVSLFPCNVGQYILCCLSDFEGGFEFFMKFFSYILQYVILS